jgi:Flp pilus assembly protein TadB
MPEGDIHEMHEQAEEARRDPSLRPVSLTMAVLAVMVAAVTLLGHRTHIEQVIAQSKAGDQWSYYQAKGVRRHNYEAFADLVYALTSKDQVKEEEIRKKFLQQADVYRDQQKEIEAEARKLETEVIHAGRKANRYNLGEVFLEIALVVTSITLLTGNRGYWVMGIMFAALGVIVAVTGFFVG